MTDALTSRLSAILLLGPTGSGKTPLGDWLQGHGLHGHRCHHFDFGANLRAVVAAGAGTAFTEQEIEFLDRVLTQGALLENEHFPLAAKILQSFIRARGIQAEDWLILNGLPRHAGQARALERFLQVRAVLELTCDADVVRERLRRDTGGDRAARTDDEETLVARKLAIYAERTRPLLAFYREQGTKVISFPVKTTTLPQDVARAILTFDAGVYSTPLTFRLTPGPS